MGKPVPGPSGRALVDLDQLMNRSPRAFGGAAIAASLVLCACHSVNPSEPAETVIAVSVFETLGDAQPAVARDMAAIRAYLQRDSASRQH